MKRGENWIHDYLELARELKASGGDPWGDWCETVAEFVERHKDDPEAIARLREIVPNAFEWIEKNERRV